MSTLPSGLTIYAEQLTHKRYGLDRSVSQELIGLTNLSLCEVLQGIRNTADFLNFKRDRMRFQLFEAGRVDLAIRSTENYLALRRYGLTVRKTIDCMITIFCIEEDHQLLHCDRDFDAFKNHLGLRVLHP